MAQGFVGCDAFRGVAFQKTMQELHRLLFVVFQLLFGLCLVACASGAPEDNLLERVAAFAVAGDVGFKDLAVKEGCLAHLLASEDGGDFQEGVNVVCAVEKGEAA